MGGICFEGIADSLIASRVITDRRHFVVCTEYLRYFYFEIIVHNRKLHKNICYHGFRAVEYTITINKRHALAFMPFDGGIK